MCCTSIPSTKRWNGNAALQRVTGASASRTGINTAAAVWAAGGGAAAAGSRRQQLEQLGRSWGSAPQPAETNEPARAENEPPAPRARAPSRRHRRAAHGGGMAPADSACD